MAGVYRGVENTEPDTVGTWTVRLKGGTGEAATLADLIRIAGSRHLRAASPADLMMKRLADALDQAEFTPDAERP